MKKKLFAAVLALSIFGSAGLAFAEEAAGTADADPAAKSSQHVKHHKKKPRKPRLAPLPLLDRTVVRSPKTGPRAGFF